MLCSSLQRSIITTRALYHGPVLSDVLAFAYRAFVDFLKLASESASAHARGRFFPNGFASAEAAAGASYHAVPRTSPSMAYAC